PVPLRLRQETQKMLRSQLRALKLTGPRPDGYNSPTLRAELMNAIMDALEAHTSLSKQALGSQKVQEGLKDVLLGPAQLYEALRLRAGEASAAI
ncbi:hypothetical protein, partial [Bosea sp. TND4EK4]|uniref:hypothetical protein n=1 Tax=Bosea sp. TND4EK4 TaxID=1907408 RepID=UPI000957365B